MNLHILPAVGLIVPLLLFYNDGFDINITNKGWYAINKKKENILHFYQYFKFYFFYYI